LESDSHSCEYTTDVMECAHTCNRIPTIFYEDIRAAPQKKNMKSLNRDHAKQNNNQANRLCTDVIRQKDTAVTFDQAVIEMEGQLQRLKMHRSRLGY
jgi:hypothetical protein